MKTSVTNKTTGVTVEVNVSTVIKINAKMRAVNSKLRNANDALKSVNEKRQAIIDKFNALLAPLDVKRKTLMETKVALKTERQTIENSLFAEKEVATETKAPLALMQSNEEIVVAKVVEVPKAKVAKTKKSKTSIAEVIEAL